MDRLRLSRRAMLAGSAAAVAAGPWLPYFWTRASQAAVAAGDRPGVAAIGTGGRGAYLGHQAARRGQIVACCDVDRRRAETFAGRYDGKCRIYGDYRRVLDRKDVDLLTIGTPDHWHAAMSIAAIDHLRGDDLTQALAEAARVVKPGGQFLVVSLNVDAWILTAMPVAAHGGGYWGQSANRERWRQRLGDAGFDVTEVGTRPATVYFLARKR